METTNANQYLGKQLRDTLWKSAFDINKKSLYHLTYVSPLEIIANSMDNNSYYSLNNSIKLYVYNILIPIINVSR